jgi:hypothetical protein
MIVVSLLLILVAVMLLVLGLAAGSSILLISSIGASLLAAVALVIGARRAAVVRRAMTPAAEPARSGRDRGGRAGAGPVRAPMEHDDRPTVAGEPAPAWAGSAGPGGRRQADPSAFADDPPAQDEGLASMGAAEARGANRDDAEAALAADAAFGEPSDPASPDSAAADLGSARESAPPEADTAWRREHAAGAAAPPEADTAWRREHAAGAAAPADESLRPDGPQRPADEAPRFDAADSGDAATSAPGRPSRPDDSSGGSDPAEEFGEPAEDDPADEPPPQAIRPVDAVRVARMTAEVLVVDGRPRYHLADCPHLVGRLTEPLPAAEAVELGFSPCGMCRPVDRLVAQAARR